MPARLSFSRLRPRLSNFQKRNNVGEPCGVKKTPAASLTVTNADLDNATKTKPQLPGRVKLTQLRQALQVIFEVLDEVDDTVRDILQGSDEGLDESESPGSSLSSVNPVVVSMDLHLADLHCCSSALRNLVSKYRPETRQSDSKSVRDVDHEGNTLDDQASVSSLPGPVTPDQQPCGCLPAPEFRSFSCSSSSLVAENNSASTQGLSRILLNSPSTLQICRQRHSSTPTTSVASVAPLKLPGQGFPTRSTPSLRIQAEREKRRAFSSPFDYELGYLDGQIDESSNMNQRHSNNAYLGEHPVQETFSSDSRCGLEPIGEVEAHHLDGRPHSLHLARYSSRHMSTEEKTSRMRTRRRGSVPSCSVSLNAEPLHMEELMAFLREGNSIRELQ